MLPYQERVISEQLELTARLLALSHYMGSEQFTLLPHEEQSRLRRQYFYMASYSSVLAERIEHFGREG